MKAQENIKEKFNRSVKALSLKPNLGLGTGISKTRIVDGLACETREGNWVFKTDMPSQVGGTETASSPGALGRAALGSCLAMSYMMWASKLDIPIDSLEVEVQADYDDNGLFGTTDVVPGYTEIRYIVRVGSPSSSKEIESFIKTVDERSPYLDVFSRAQNCVRQIEVTQIQPKS